MNAYEHEQAPSPNYEQELAEGFLLKYGSPHTAEPKVCGAGAAVPRQNQNSRPWEGSSK